MSLSPGTALGPYQITSTLGAGGMGEVYKARDTRLNRTVAIKVLRSHETADPEARERFDREAKSIAALSHPHICPLFDVGQVDATEFLVMEFLEGETLAALLARGKLPLDRALAYADQIADALAAAHAAGIIHRDLKPGNIMITKSGAKLLDFGLAKLRHQDGLVSQRDTATQRGLTRAGMIVGTLQYMAPEQLDGLEADTRTDIFGLGSVLYEMLTGHSPHRAPTTAGLVAAIMREPPPSARGEIPDVPPLVDAVIRKCLEKNPERRWQSVEALREALTWAAQSSPADAVPATPASRRLRTAAAALLIVALVAGTWMVSRMFLPAAADAPLIRSDIDVPRTIDLGFDTTFALSPDARWVAIAAGGGLWLRSLEDSTFRQLPGTAGAHAPFWSPDNRSIAFFAEGKLKRLDLPEGVPAILADAPNARSGAWSRAGVIVFAPTALGPLLQVPARGGGTSPATALDETRQEDSHRAPHFLEDGRRFTYFARSRQSPKNSVRIGSLDGTPAPGTIVVQAGVESGAAGVVHNSGQPGHLLYVRNGELVAERFDERRVTLSGEPSVLATRVRTGDLGGGFSVSGTGAVVYRAMAPQRHRPRWIGRSGQLLGMAAEPGAYDTISLSANRRKLAAGRAIDDAGTIGLWIFEFDRNMDTRVPLAGKASSGIWAPDGEHIAVAWARAEEHPNVYVVDLGGRDEPRAVLPPGGIRWPLDWSRDGTFLLFAQVEPATRFDIWAVRMTGGDRTPVPVVRGPGKDNEARFSPDGRFIAYQTDDSGATRVYLMRFQPQRGPRVLVSDGEGAEPRWREDGRELYYISKDRAVMAVPFEARGDDLVPGRPVRLFGGPSGERVWHFEPDLRGERFLVLPLNEEPDTTPLHLLTGWRSRVP